MAEDGLISQHLVEFLDDPKFARAYARGKATGALASHLGDIRFRVNIAWWAATQALSLDGDFLECGVRYGFLSKTNLEYLHFFKAQKHFFLFDTDIGIPSEQGKASEKENMQRLNETLYAEPYFEKWRLSFQSFQMLNWFKAFSLKVLKTKKLM